ncbi:MAG: acyl carrier protein [Gammaproteobacteria bacterium]|nr:acyl carrier protein [Gammaproteobacteria bacterium]
MEVRLSPAELEVAGLIIETLNLEDVTAAEIEPDAPLFGDGLGLDSIDALELSLMVSRRYGIQMRSDDPDNALTFASLRALTRHIEAHRN